MINKEKLKEFVLKQEENNTKIENTRLGLQKVVLASNISVEEMENLINIYDPWKPGEEIKINDIRRHSGKLYIAIQQHPTQTGWEPNLSPALWKEYTPKTTEDGEEIVPDWKQPLGGHDAYKKGDKVLFEGAVYESLIDNNAHSPAANPQGWEKIS